MLHSMFSHDRAPNLCAMAPIIVRFSILFFCSTRGSGLYADEPSSRPLTTQPSKIILDCVDSDGTGIKVRSFRIENPVNELHEKIDFHVVDEVYRCTVSIYSRGSEKDVWNFLDYTHKLYTRHPNAATTFLSAHRDGNYLFIVYVNDFGATNIDTIVLGHDEHDSKLLNTSYVWKDSDTLGIRATSATFEGSISAKSLSVVIHNYSESANPNRKKVGYDAATDSWK